MFSAPTLCPAGLAHLQEDQWPLTTVSGVCTDRALGGAGCSYGTEGWQEWVPRGKRRRSRRRARARQGLSQLGSLSLFLHLPGVPSHTPGLSSELYIPPSWTAAPAEGPFTNSLRGPALAQPQRLVRGDGDKPVSGPQQDLCSRRTGALGAG